MLVVPPYLFDEFKAAGKTGILDRCLERVRNFLPPRIFPIRFTTVRIHGGRMAARRGANRELLKRIGGFQREAHRETWK